jgi:hypothetical protein
MGVARPISRPSSGKKIARWGGLSALQRNVLTHRIRTKDGVHFSLTGESKFEGTHPWQQANPMPLMIPRWLLISKT